MRGAAWRNSQFSLQHGVQTTKHNLGQDLVVQWRNLGQACGACSQGLVGNLGVQLQVYGIGSIACSARFENYNNSAAPTQVDKIEGGTHAVKGWAPHADGPEDKWWSYDGL